MSTWARVLLAAVCSLTHAEAQTVDEVFHALADSWKSTRSLDFGENLVQGLGEGVTKADVVKYLRPDYEPDIQDGKLMFWIRANYTFEDQKYVSRIDQRSKTSGLNVSVFYDGVRHTEFDPVRKFARVSNTDSWPAKARYVRTPTSFELFRFAFGSAKEPLLFTELQDPGRWEKLSQYSSLAGKTVFDGHDCVVIEIAHPDNILEDQAAIWRVFFGEDVGLFPIRAELIRPDSQYVIQRTTASGIAKVSGPDGFERYFATEITSENWDVRGSGRGALSIQAKIDLDSIELNQPYGPEVFAVPLSQIEALDDRDNPDKSFRTPKINETLRDLMNDSRVEDPTDPDNGNAPPVVSTAPADEEPNGSTVTPYIYLALIGLAFLVIGLAGMRILVRRSTVRPGE